MTRTCPRPPSSHVCRLVADLWGQRHRQKGCPAGTVELSAPTAVGFLAAAAAKVALERRIDRVKICPADDCRWAFYDTSRNRSRQWCSMEVCGNRAKARTHRQRSAPA